MENVLFAMLGVPEPLNHDATNFLCRVGTSTGTPAFRRWIRYCKATRFHCDFGVLALAPALQRDPVPHSFRYCKETLFHHEFGVQHCKEDMFHYGFGVPASVPVLQKNCCVMISGSGAGSGTAKKNRCIMISKS